MNWKDYHLIEVKWCDEIAEVYVIKRQPCEGSVYRVTFNNRTEVFFGIDFDTDMRNITEFLNDEQKARRTFNYFRF